MKINKKIIEELVSYLKEFNLSEIEYGDKDLKIKVCRNLKEISSASEILEVKKKR